MRKNYFFIKIFCFLIFLFFILSPAKIFAYKQDNQKNNIAIFINQVRGEECCQPGSTQDLEKQINAFKSKEIKATFVIRYDALTDYDYQKIFNSLDKNNFELGAFLEITPELAFDSGVEYTANETNWSQAQNAYTVGYSKEDRVKIIDTYMNEFKNIFGYFPQTTTAWVMDTTSLNYLHDKYNVKSHQITREQWGTDSYTMSGGPVHYPYFASRNWAFMPSERLNNKDKGNLLILRQTGSDPLYNYGDTTNAFTTQPNDYFIDNKNIEYFNKLINQFMSQTTNEYNFVLLGLENSMFSEAQSEFINQINIIGNNDSIKTLTANDFYNQYSDLVSDTKITTLLGTDLINNNLIESFWINTPNYRVRLLKNNNQLKITDIRFYNQDIEDPYNATIAQKYAYWITPFIFDGSRFYTQSKIEAVDFKSKLREKILPELQTENLELKSSQKDFVSKPNSIIFNIKENSKVSYKKENNQVIIEYVNNLGEKSIMKFGENSFSTPGISDKNIIANNSDFLKIENDKIFFQDSYGLIMNCDKTCYFTFSQPSNEEYKKLRKEFYSLFFPEIISRGIDNNNSTYYAHNRYAVVGKNPIRFVFIPKDNIGYSTLPKGFPKVITLPEVSNTILHEQEGNGTTFFDVEAQNIGKYMVTFQIDSFEQIHDVYITPNCKIQKLYCVTHPNQAIWYLKAMLYTKLRDF